MSYRVANLFFYLTAIMAAIGVLIAMAGAFYGTRRYGLVLGGLLLTAASTWVFLRFVLDRLVEGA